MRLSRLAVFFPLFLAACSNPPVLTPPLEYSRLAKINLDVKDLSFVDRGVDAPPPWPIVTDQYRPTVTDALRQWASERLQAVGAVGQAAFVVKNAYIAEQSTPSESGWLTRGQGSKLIAHAEIELDARGNEGYALATTNANHFVSLPDNPDSDERKNAYHSLINGLMQNVDKYLEESIQGHMRNFIVTAPVIGSKLPPLSPVTPPPIPTIIAAPEPEPVSSSDSVVVRQLPD
ncbi:MAG: hypothetical protein AB7H77_08190 [Bdellovibrionales bacterium]